MATDRSVAAGSLPSAQVVGNAFAHQFYTILHQSPKFLYRFYQESSKLGRPDADGVMDSVTTMRAINEKILVMCYSEFKAVIKTVDAHESLNGGVIVLVTGCLTGMDMVKKGFTQSFFLAPQDKGYFVLNDIFRYMDEDDHQQGTVGLSNGTVAPLSPEQDSPLQEQAVEEQTPPPTLEEEEEEEEEEENGEEVYNPSDKEEEFVVVEEEALEEEVIDEVPSDSQAAVANQAAVADPSPSATVHEEAPMKSYTSIASPIMIGSRQAYVRTTGSGVNNIGRFAPTRRAGFRSDGVRGRGSYDRGGLGELEGVSTVEDFQAVAADASSVITVHEELNELLKRMREKLYDYLES